MTIFNDFLAESEDLDEEKDNIGHNFELLPKVMVIMASTLNEEVLAKTARYLFSVLELASETSDPMSKIGQLLSPQALGFFNEALWSLKHKTYVSFSLGKLFKSQAVLVQLSLNLSRWAEK